MKAVNSSLISIIVPVYNERAGLAMFHQELTAVLATMPEHTYEIVYCNDGSTDGSADIIRTLHKNDPRVRLLSLSRNFGKEITTTAGLHAATGEAIITLDADGQHPVELLPKFIAKWQAGKKVVIGVRTANEREGTIKRYGSKLFYRLFSRLAAVQLVPGATDYRLIDKSVQAEFARMNERNRITRGLIDWLGFDRDYIYFKAKARQAGEASYSVRKLVKLAVDSIISLSISPLYMVAYIGAIVLPVSVLIGVVMLGNVILGDPLALHATASAYVIVFMLFLIGVLLVSQGIIGLYLSHIHTETQNRPLYIIDKDQTF